MPEVLPLRGRLVHLEPMSPVHARGLVLAATEDRSTYQFTYVPADEAAVDRYIGRARLDEQTGLAVTYTVLRALDGKIAGTTRLRDLEYWRAGVWPPRPGHLNPDGVPDAGQIGSTWLAPWAQRSGGAEVEAQVRQAACGEFAERPQYGPGSAKPTHRSSSAVRCERSR